MLQRIQRRAGRLLRELVPHNLRYRPTGVHPHSQALAAQPGSGATYQEIAPAYTSRLAVPPGFHD
ncbi:MAG: hypothetical protein EOO59_07730, partial [Hymenobacter sp.]